MKTIKLNIKYTEDRKRIVQGLANNGIKVWVEEEKIPNTISTNYFVCFKHEENLPKEK